VTLYHYSVGTNCHEDGVSVFLVKGESVTVEGRPMVRLLGGNILAADRWHETEQLAREAAADQVGRMGIRLLDQAATLRLEVPK